MVLLESGGEVPGQTTSAASSAAPVVAAKATRAGGGNAATRKQPGHPQDPEDGQYQVWQLISPQGGQQDLQFEYRLSSRTSGWPMKVFKLSVVVR